MIAVSISDLCRLTSSKWVFSCFFSAIIGSAIFTPFAMIYEFDPRTLDFLVAGDPIKTILVLTIVVLPFLALASYVYEKRVRPLIINRGWSEDSFRATAVIYFLSLIAMVAYILVLFLLSILIS